MMNSYKNYMNDPDIINEPMPMREIHAIRLMIYDETKNMTPEERVKYVHDQTQEIIDRYGFKVNSHAQQKTIETV